MFGLLETFEMTEIKGILFDPGTGLNKGTEEGRDQFRTDFGGIVQENGVKSFFTFFLSYSLSLLLVTKRADELSALFKDRTGSFAV
jgi:hypothetical protein